MIPHELKYLKLDAKVTTCSLGSITAYKEECSSLSVMADEDFEAPTITMNSEIPAVDMCYIFRLEPQEDEEDQHSILAYIPINEVLEDIPSNAKGTFATTCRNLTAHHKGVVRKFGQGRNSKQIPLIFNKDFRILLVAQRGLFDRYYFKVAHAVLLEE